MGHICLILFLLPLSQFLDDGGKEINTELAQRQFIQQSNWAGELGLSGGGFLHPGLGKTERLLAGLLAEQNGKRSRPLADLGVSGREARLQLGRGNMEQKRKQVVF